MAVNLCSDTKDMIRKNEELIKEDVNMRLNFVDRIKITVFVFAMQALYPDDELEKTLRSHLMRNQHLNSPMKMEEASRFETSEKLDELVKANVRNKLTNPNYATKDNIAILRLCCKSMNDRYFQAPLETFYRAVVLYMLEREEPEGLRDHPNFDVLKSIKAVVEDSIRTAYAPLLKSSYMDRIEAYYKDHQCDFVADDADTLGDNFDDCFSLRSFKGLLLFKPWDLFSNSNHLDDA